MGSCDYRQKREQNYPLPTEKILTFVPTWTDIIDICFQKEEIRKAFVLFLVYEVTTLKVTIEFPVIFIPFGGRSMTRGFAGQLPVLEPTKPPALTFQTRCLFTVQP